MRLGEFADLHGPALERDELKYNLILGLLGRMRETEPPDVRLWTLGAPGECAMAVLTSGHIRAMQSISTSNGPCHGSTQTKLRAGNISRIPR